MKLPLRLRREDVPRLVVLLVGVGVLVALDQGFKTWVRHSVPLHGPINVVDGFFRLIYARNPGIAFSMFRDVSAGIRIPALILVSGLASLGVLVYYLKIPRSDTTVRIALILILGGALGNLFDRVVFGEVTDFLDFYVSSGAVYDFLRARRWYTHWATFNFADAFLVVGMVMLLLRSLREPAGQKTQVAASNGAV